MKTLLAVASVAVLAGCAYHHEDEMLAPSVTVSGSRPVLPGVAPGSTVRIFRAGRQPVQGTLLEPDSGVVRVATHLDSISVAARDVDSVWVYRGRAGKGAVIGASILGGLGALMLGTLADGLCDTSDCQVAEATAMGGVLGIMVGGGLGALLGVAASDWQTVYRAPRAAR